MGTSAGIFCLANPLLVIIHSISTGILTALTRYARLSQFFSLLLVTLPVAFFLPIFPPWLPPGLDIGFVTGLMVSGIILVTIPKYVKPTIDAFRGKEYKIGKEKIIFKDESEEKEARSN